MEEENLEKEKKIIYYGSHIVDNSWGFFDEDNKHLCQNPVEITEEYHNELLNGQAAGRPIERNELGYPFLGEIKQKTLEEYKIEKREIINQERDKAEQSGFEYLGKIFDSDPVSCQRISCAAQAMSLMPVEENEPVITWTCQDNSTIDLSQSQLSGLVVALANWSNKCHEKATSLKNQIEEAESFEEIDAINWN